MMHRIYNYFDMTPNDFFGFLIATLLYLALAPPIAVAAWRWALKP